MEVRYVIVIAVIAFILGALTVMVTVDEKECPTPKDRTFVCNEAICNCNITMPPPLICPEGKQVRTTGLDTCIKMLQEQKHITESLESAIQKYRK